VSGCYFVEQDDALSSRDELIENHVASLSKLAKANYSKHLWTDDHSQRHSSQLSG